MIVLSEIADRSLSTSANDTGTSIRIIGVQLRLFARWVETRKEADSDPTEFPNIHVKALSVMDLLDDAFTALDQSLEKISISTHRERLQQIAMGKEG